MIVKKMPILQGFPAPEVVKNLSEQMIETAHFSPVFYDIETTGLARNSSFCYLIGAVAQVDEKWQFLQWMAENEGEEREILCEFFDFLSDFTVTIQYNGDRFDQPFLEARYRKYGMTSPFEGKLSLDLYRELRPCQRLLKLERMKQPDMEAFLGIRERDYCDGGKCIRLYKTYVKKPDPQLAETVMGHNEEDLKGLGRIVEMLGYRALTEGLCEPLDAVLEDDSLILSLALPFSLPVTVSAKGEGFYLTADDRKARLLLPLKEGRLRRYYAAYKEYEYLPAEDTAIARSLSQYMDRSLRVPATPETCYTWFSCDQTFLSDKDRQRAYLHSTLPCLLELL